MNGRTLTLAVAAMSVSALVGCGGKTFELTFTNVTNQPRDISLDTPFGPTFVGVVPPAAGRLHKNLKFSKDDLPATCTLRAGKLMTTFTLDKNMEAKQYFYLEENMIVGPIDKNTSYRGNSKLDAQIKAGTNTLITGDGPAVPPSGSGGIKVPIEQGEVVE